MEQNWYTPYEAPRTEAQPPRRRRGRRTLLIVLICLAVIGVIALSCVLFRNIGSRLLPELFHRDAGTASIDPKADADGPGNTLPDPFGNFSFDFGMIPDGGSDDDGRDEEGFYDNYQDFFSHYYTSFEQAEECNIPRVDKLVRLELPVRDTHGERLTLQELYTRCSPSIVSIMAFPDADDLEGSYFWGTGVIISADGYIVTNAHIIEGTEYATITLQDNREYEAKLVGIDSRSDLAVLKIEATGLTPAEFGTSDALSVGDDVAAIGNPLGDTFRATLTNGIVSGIDRDISYNGTTLTLIQTTAALNEGNSGGALFNMYGQVVGITNMKMSSSSVGSVTIEGVGFAIPSSTVKKVTDSLLAYGRLLGKPALGITVGVIPSNVAEHYSLPNGLYVSEVKESSDCYKQGLRTGDVIMQVNGNPVALTTDLTSLIDTMQVGDELRFTVFRGGETLEMTVHLIESSDVY